MNCERAKELMIDALVEPLDEARLKELHDHLEACQSCTAEAAGYERAWRSLEIIAIPDPRSDGDARLRKAVAEEFGVDIRSKASKVKSTMASRPEWRIAAAIMLIALGSLLTFGLRNFFGGDSDDIVADSRSRYVLIMTATREPAEQIAQAQAEFDAWIADLIERGIMETGFGLADQPPVGTPPNGVLMDLNVSGFIVIRADDAQEARRIAVSSPVIDYGGFIEIRELEGNDADQ